jgi:hypothetical protein
VIRIIPRAVLLPAIVAASLILAVPVPAAPNGWHSRGSLNIPRAKQSATLLADGRVLIAGGVSGEGGYEILDSGELYSPHDGTWTVTASVSVGRVGHTATRLNDGRVLVAGGYGSNNQYLASAELFDPRSGAWQLIHSMKLARGGHTATLLADGMVLIAAARPTPPCSQKRTCTTLGLGNGSELRTCQFLVPGTPRLVWRTAGSFSPAAPTPGS